MGKFWVQFWAQSALPGWNRDKVSDNLDATGVVLVIPMVTSLIWRPFFHSTDKRIQYIVSSIKSKFDNGFFLEESVLLK